MTLRLPLQQIERAAGERELEDGASRFSWGSERGGAFFFVTKPCTVSV